MPSICRGFSDALPCLFSATQPGMPARGNPTKENQCVFCNEDWMEEACRTPRGRHNITRSLKTFRAHYEERSFVYNTAMMRVPEEWHGTFHEPALQGRRGPARKPRSRPRSQAMWLPMIAAYLPRRLRTGPSLWSCGANSGRGAFARSAVPCSHIPQPLRKLNSKLIEALRPLDIDVGPHKQAGNVYRIHSAMARFSWSKIGVQAKIRKLRNRRQREKAEAAYDYLMTEEAESSYRDFVKKHNKFLRKFPEATDADRRRPLQFIETVGLECYLWPSLYWCTEMCALSDDEDGDQALIDTQRQCGFPALFKTMAPWEYSFPYHVFVLDEMEKGGRGRMQLAGLETLHTAHVFTELSRGLYSGLNKTAAQDGWKDHILASTAAEGSNKTVVNYFQRLEFQDGKRKLPTQDYYGSGRVHVHSLDYLQNVEEIGLEHKMSATAPDAEEQPALRGYMLGRPHGRSDSGWPVKGGESRYDPEDKIVRLHHTEEDKASAFSVARRVLFDYQPAEPEMWLYLCAQQTPPCRYGGTMVPFIAPWSGMETRPQVVKAYEDSEWRREDMSLLEFCRKTNKDGRIAQRVVKLHKAAGDVQPADDEATKLRKLHDFANSCTMSGEKLMACDMLSLFNDRWFGQWLALRQPFRCLDDLMLPEVREKVSPQYVHFANAVLQCPEFWQDEVLAQRALVEKFLSGELAKEDTDGAQEALREVGLLPEEEDPMFKDIRFNERQERLEKGICKLLDRAKDSVEVMDCLTQYDMIAVDAISQLSQKDCDFWQLPGVQPSKATDSPKWHMVHQIELHDMWRCKDETLRQKLVALRAAMPRKELLKRICLRHKVPHTTVATCTKRRAAHVNDLSIWVLFTTQRKRRLAKLKVDWESNADNYDEKNKLIA
ncbi:Pif1, partial [Symbiodinium sp. CCMP2456]